MPPNARRLRRYYVLVGVGWGLLASFSFAIGGESATLYQGLALGLALTATLLERRSLRPLTAWASNRVGILLGVHSFIAVVSGVLAGSSSAAILRYVLLLPAMSLLIAMASARRDVLRSLMSGLSISGVVFVLFHIAQLDPASLLEPESRLWVFLNPNGVAFIAALTAISLLSTAAGESIRRDVVVYGACAASSIVCVATKSRTALLALIAGVLTHVLIRARSSRRTKVALVGASVAAMVIALTTDITSHIADSLTRVYMLDDQYRSIESGTYRYETWWYVLTEMWPKSPLLGVGPGQHVGLLEAAMDVSGAHNGLLANLAEVGLLGTLPLVAILVIVTVKCRRHTEVAPMLPLVVAGIVESGAETMFFSMGNTGSLLFMAALASLATPARSAAEQAPISEQRRVRQLRATI